MGMKDDATRGVEALIRKAAIDPEFMTLLLEKRAAAAVAVGLSLEPHETELLENVPGHQLENIIACARVCSKM